MTSEPAKRLEELPESTRLFLTNLSQDDVKVLQTGLPILKHIIGFGKVTMWIWIAIASLLAGIVLLGESFQKILSWFKA